MKLYLSQRASERLLPLPMQGRKIFPAARFSIPPLRETYDFHPQNAIAFLGTSDPWSDIEKVTGISRGQKIPLFLYPDANHSLETKDTLDNIKTLRNVMEETKRFLTS